MTNKVVTITLNPALDLTGSLDVLNVGSVNLVKQGSLHAAGKGVNVAKVLSDLGAKVTVTGFLGRDNQELFCQLFDQMAAIDEFVRVDGATRINVKLVEKSGEVSDINFPGVEVTPLAIEQFERTLERLAADHDYFVLAGSLPQGISPALCASWIEKLHSMGKKVLFDSSRDALKAGLDAKPWLIKPNDEELSQFVGRELHTPEQCQAAAAQLAEKGIENIVVSMGANGVMWLNQHQWLHAKPPRMQVVSTVGAGDTLVAGLCWGHMQQMEKTELLTFATALSALAVTQVGVGMSNRKQLETLQQQIQLQPVSLSANS
ncbi:MULTISPECIES: 1-phosphofructokinase [unclassified Vibrio]|uniref:1-phosphofructokinase n=1 Tax=unclassified Vibrio TaxID=2614977 RepID=UPI000B8E5ECB|nr:MULTISPECIES: 1-phosphofructokinase [unclassified Vibrio]NAW91293.1 1-phosphofructokinase [Vibrio sp. V24_P1S3T111]OXX25274.1 1-phosphofructokinase [Vibrio sp. V05_P4A8T149]OXX25402.1 1-phosphofructokinase [Vibrio sp. V06_P1A73T115]OXX29817.1 1-phosphofructokinase [Vibrio sp. V14_P6S14T42]OXX30578.1 1-phosphofructokinase [Vibrio sp. V04_P4A5T148]